MVVFDLLVVISSLIIELKWSAFGLIRSVMINVLSRDFSKRLVNIHCLQ